MKGKFITIDGIDGSGKTTQAEMLSKYLKGNGIKSIVTKEPTSGKIGSLLRNHYLKTDFPLIDSFLFSADREEHLKTEVIPTMEKGTYIISDRYYHSALAYQYTSGVDLDWLIH
ncbi:MAG: dTMP kinase, partial [Candidatus Portnoybacteria bacterium CG10_big_fil_rev_8_21_14_0_10_36_7]